jgi:uncharacterized RDD family membrane protein YckC
MSDTFQGHGWWIASDGKWYPPHQHPQYVPPPPPTPPPPPSSWSSQGPAAYAPPPWPSPPGQIGVMDWAPPSVGAIDPVLHLPLAPWWKRLLAIIIDGIVIGLGFAVVALVISVIVALATHHHNTSATNTTGSTSSSNAFGGFVAIWIVTAIPAAIYYACLNGSKRGQTVGKLALGIAVRDARTGGRIGFWRGLGRFLIEMVFMVLLYIPYVIDSLAPLWNPRRQSWHDRVAHTIVVDLKP